MRCVLRILRLPERGPWPLQIRSERSTAARYQPQRIGSGRTVHDPIGVSAFTFAVTVTDALGASGAIKAAFNVLPHISLQGVTVTQKVGIAFAVPLPYSGGTPGGAAKVALAKGVLPPGAVLSINPKAFQVVVSVPAQRLAGSYVAVLVLTDASPCSASATCASSATVTIDLG